MINKIFKLMDKEVLTTTIYDEEYCGRIIDYEKPEDSGYDEYCFFFISKQNDHIFMTEQEIKDIRSSSP